MNIVNWKLSPVFPDRYQVSNTGKIRSKLKGVILSRIANGVRRSKKDFKKAAV